MDEKEINRLFTSEEARLRSILKADIQAAIRSERTILLDHAERVIAEKIAEASASIVADLQKRLDAHRAYVDAKVAYVDGKRDEIAAERQKYFEQLLGLADNLEERLVENIDLHVARAFVKVSDEYKQKGAVFVPKID